jgi:hypothetical protein
MKTTDLHDNDHLACRDLKHAWQWENDFIPVRGDDDRKRRTVSVTRILTCIRCGTRRYDEYVDGYHMHNTKKGRIRVAEIRHEIYRRLREKARA